MKIIPKSTKFFLEKFKIAPIQVFTFSIITAYLSVFSSNVGKYGPQITPNLDAFHAVNDIYIFKI